ncbi:MAG: helix-turn-helix transcriptional regulator [Lachnospiraceae bacterium]|nr:helix-turn-helix transcriptional regulator [Lachnospiraceae bacterium]
MDYYAIGQRIRKVRKARGLSQEKLAEKVGISTTHMSHIETANTKMSLPTFAELAAVLEVRTDELLYDDRPEDRSTSIAYITELLDDCTIQQVRIIEDIVKATKESLNKNI